MQNINSKWIEDLNLRAKTIKLLQVNMQLNLPDLGFVNKFLNMTPRAKATKEKIENLGYIKMKNFCASRM